MGLFSPPRFSGVGGGQQPDARVFPGPGHVVKFKQEFLYDFISCAEKHVGLGRLCRRVNMVSRRETIRWQTYTHLLAHWAMNLAVGKGLAEACCGACVLYRCPNALWLGCREQWREEEAGECVHANPKPESTLTGPGVVTPRPLELCSPRDSPKARG